MTKINAVRRSKVETVTSTNFKMAVRDFGASCSVLQKTAGHA
jgi:hypothetical protein